jgi:hypothetical protein
MAAPKPKRQKVESELRTDVQELALASKVFADCLDVHATINELIVVGNDDCWRDARVAGLARRQGFLFFLFF